MADEDRPHPPQQAKHPGRPSPAPDAERRAHERAMRRPNEPLNLASHALSGRKAVPKPDAE
jgi:hypothetical protein